MSLLTLIREETIVANVRAAGYAWEKITNELQDAAKRGETRVKILATALDKTECEHAITTLKLQGFYADWGDCGERDIVVSWLPRVK